MMRTMGTRGGRISADLGHKAGAQAPQDHRATVTLQKHRGFTLVEMIVTLTVAAVIAAVTIPSLVTWYTSYKATERQANAELIYTTAQNNIAQLKASGQLDDSRDGTTTALDGQRATLVAAANKAQVKAAVHTGDTADAPNDAGITLLSSDDGTACDALDLLVPNIDDALSRVGYSSMSHATGAHYRIEYNATLGYVYRVFFSESEISQTDYEQAAEAAANHDDAKLAELGISYYGGTRPKTFSPSDRQPARWVGYFEFANDSTGRTNVTGGYYYQINADNTVSGGAVDHLHNGNEIDEGAVNSSDGTAYGVLVSKSETSRPGFVAPTDVNLNTYDVTLTNGFGAEGVDPNCVFYKMDAPSSSADAGQQATYTIHYDFYRQDAGSDQPAFNWTAPSDGHRATAGSTVRVTNDDLNSLWGGQIRNDIDSQGYRIDVSRSKLSGTVAADGSLVLTVALLPKGAAGYDETATDIPDPTVKDGVGAWYPWSASSNKDLNKLAFYVDQNFAGCISKGKDAPTGNAATTYQVRTDDQLQHIGSPYGSTYGAPNVSYLDKAFFQTHDITIDQLWYPIGQEQSDAKAGDKTIDTKARFSGNFYGGYSGYATEDHSALAAPTADGQAFAITLAKRTDTNDENGKGSLFSANPAYSTTDGYRSYGIFGFVTGDIAYARISVGAESEGLDLSGSFDTPHYGTLVGDLDGSVSNSSVTIPKSSSLRIRQGDGSQGERNADDAIVGGLCGRMRRKSSITNSSLTLEDNDAHEDRPRLELAATPRENIKESISIGGFVGYASCDNDRFLSNCSVNLGDDATIDAQGNTSGGRQVSAGGFVGYAKEASDQASIEDCGMALGGALTVGTPDSNGAWSNPSYIGGFAGYVEGGSGIKNASIEAADNDNANASIAANAKANGVRAAAGGMFGYLHNTGFDTATLNVDGDLNVVAASTNSDGHAGGLVGRADSDDSSLTLEKASLTVGGNAAIANSVTVNNAPHASYDAHAGGLAGSLSNMVLSNATATVNGDGKSLKVSADNAHTSAAAGGLVGELEKTSTVTTPRLTTRALTVTSSNDNGPAISGGLVGKATASTGKNGTISNATTTVNGDADIESTGAQQYALSGLLAGQLQSVGVDGAASNVTGSLTSKSTDTNGASARAAGLIAQFEDGDSLKTLTLDVGKALDAAAASTNGSALSGGLLAYASHGSSPLQATGASLNVTGNVRTACTAQNTGQGSFSGALAGQLRSVGLDGPSVTVGGSLTSSVTSDGGPTYAGGLIGSTGKNGETGAGALSKVGSTLHDVSVTAASSRGDAHAGGLAGRDDSSPISESGLVPQGSLSVSASNSDKAPYAGGYVGSVTNTSISNATFSPTGNVAVNATTSNWGTGTSAGGFAGASSSTGLSGISMNPGGTVSVSANGNSDVCAGGLVAQANGGTLADSSLVPRANLSVAGNSKSKALVGGLAGRASSLTASNVALRPAASVTVNGACGSDAHAGGLMGDVDGSNLAYLSLLESARAGNASVAISGGDDNGGQGQSNVGGGFGSVENTDVSNSYVVTRNATLALTNRDNGGCTGGFAGSASADSGSHSITTSYVSASIQSSAPTLSGFADFTSASDGNLLFASDFAIESIEGNVPVDGTAAFMRTVSFVNGLRGDYAVVTDASGATPYKFAINGDLNAEDGTERCFVYRTDSTQLVDEKFDQHDGAHPASYAYLTRTDNTPIAVPWEDPKKNLQTSSVLDYLGTTNILGSRRNYNFVLGSSVTNGFRDGANPFPTATRDKSGNYINYGRWPTAPAGQVAPSDEDPPSTGDTRGDGGTTAGQLATGQGTANASSNSTDGSAGTTSSGRSANGSSSSGTNASAPSTGSSSAGSISSTSDDANGGNGDDH